MFGRIGTGFGRLGAVVAKIVSGGGSPPSGNYNALFAGTF